MRGAVYMLIADERIMYVGQSVCPANRISQHRDDGRVFGSAVGFESHRPKKIESALIRLLRPPWNVAEVSDLRAADIAELRALGVNITDPVHAARSIVSAGALGDVVLAPIDKLPERVAPPWTWCDTLRVQTILAALLWTEPRRVPDLAEDLDLTPRDVQRLIAGLREAGAEITMEAAGRERLHRLVVMPVWMARAVRELAAAPRRASR